MKYFIPEDIVSDLPDGDLLRILQSNGGWYQIKRGELSKGYYISTNEDLSELFTGFHHGEGIKISD